MHIMIYAANAGDRNERGIRGAVALGTLIGDLVGTTPQIIGVPSPVITGGWTEQLEAATPNLALLAQALRTLLNEGVRPLLTMGRCAASIATLPSIATRYPDAAIIWFDAHGDSNSPTNDCAADMSYLGGMVITGAAGEWQTGLGDGVDFANVILVGARDLDPPEQERINARIIDHVPAGPNLAERLEAAICGRRVYIHLDCDVLDSGLLATEYQCPAGLSFADLADTFDMLSRHDVLGLEITEYEDCWPDGERSDPSELITSIGPVLARLRMTSAVGAI